MKTEVFGTEVMTMYPWIEKPPIHDVTKQFVMYYLLDLPLPETAKGEFGLETLVHYMALRAVLFGEDAYTPDDAQQQLTRRIVEVEAWPASMPWCASTRRRMPRASIS